MKKPEWLKKIEDSIAAIRTIWNDDTALRIANHLGHDSIDPNAKIHRGIYVSTVSPTNSDGSDGDIWLTIEG